MTKVIGDTVNDDKVINLSIFKNRDWIIITHHIPKWDSIHLKYIINQFNIIIIE